MDMHDPSHPGDIIREDCWKPLGLTVTTAAKGSALRGGRCRSC